MECIVFNQEELLGALESGCASICICDGEYYLPLTAGVSYLAIGNVRACVQASAEECEAAGMGFLNFTPVYLGQAPVSVPLKFSGAVNSGSNGGSYGSFASSGASSNSYRLAGSYSLTGSYRLAGSYRYAASFVGSHRYFWEYEFEYGSFGSYRYASSFKTSLSGSYTPSGSYAPAGSYTGVGSYRAEAEADGYIPVFGYGINLI